MNKRAQGMSINTIVVMVLALIVLAVVLFLTYKYILKGGEQAGGLGQCKAQGAGAHCSDRCTDAERGFPGLGCPEQGAPENQVLCCVPKTP
ncbi:MAG: hypothetical protein AABY13_00640 [Nanoarchaeota archaeon]